MNQGREKQVAGEDVEKYQKIWEGVEGRGVEEDQMRNKARKISRERRERNRCYIQFVTHLQSIKQIITAKLISLYLFLSFHIKGKDTRKKG